MSASQLTQCSKAAASCIGLPHPCCSGHGSQSQTAHSGSVPHCPCNNSCLWPNATSASRLSAQELDEYSTWGDIFPGAHYSDVRHEDKLRLMLMVPAQDYKQKLKGGVACLSLSQQGYHRTLWWQANHRQSVPLAVSVLLTSLEKLYSMLTQASGYHSWFQERLSLSLARLAPIVLCILQCRRASHIHHALVLGLESLDWADLIGPSSNTNMQSCERATNCVL